MTGSFTKLRAERIAQNIAAIAGYKRYALAFLLGSLSALALPPFYAMPLLWLIYPAFICQFDGITRKRQAFGLGWSFAFGQFVFGLYWIAYSMFTDIAHWWWAVPFSVCGLPACFAIYQGLLLALWWIVPSSGAPRLLFFATCFTVAEWLRSQLFTGFPWNLTAHGWIGWLPILQIYSVMGGYALSLITIAAAAIPFLFTIPTYPKKFAAIAVFAGIGLFVATGIWGALRLYTADTQSDTGLTVRLVQPNVSQKDKWTKDLARQHFQTLLNLSSTDAPVKPDIVIWPEASVPYLGLSPSLTQAMAGVLKPGSYLLAGTIRLEDDGSETKYYNSLEVIDSSGKRLAYRDKFHLTPFGEYMPFRKTFHLDSIAVGSGDLSAGDGPKTMNFTGIPSFSPFICYEAAFPSEVVAPGPRPKWLVNITNDGWFGASTGPRQHFAMARARAVEQGLPLLRAANTGISGAVDPYGRVITSLLLEKQGFLDVNLPNPAKEPFYARYHDLLFLILTFSTTSIMLVNCFVLRIGRINSTVIE